MRFSVENWAKGVMKLYCIGWMAQYSESRKEMRRPDKGDEEIRKEDIGKLFGLKLLMLLMIMERKSHDPYEGSCVSFISQLLWRWRTPTTIQHCDAAIGGVAALPASCGHIAYWGSRRVLLTPSRHVAELLRDSGRRCWRLVEPPGQLPRGFCGADWLEAGGLQLLAIPANRSTRNAPLSPKGLEHEGRSSRPAAWQHDPMQFQLPSRPGGLL